jgi:hypothetical protein
MYRSTVKENSNRLFSKTGKQADRPQTKPYSPTALHSSFPAPAVLIAGKRASGTSRVLIVEKLK